MDIARHGDSFLNTTPLCIFLLVIIISASSSKATTNLLMSGELLRNNSKLGYPDSNVSLEFRGDCNLVLYNDQRVIVWESRPIQPVLLDCFLSLTDHGRLLVDGSWISPNDPGELGTYVAVLHPEGKLSIHGPRVWHVGDGQESISNNNNGIVSSITNLKSSQTAYNVLFSGQELLGNGKLTDGEYSFIFEECGLILKKSSGEVLWKMSSRVKNPCNASLNHKGELVIQDATGTNFWKNDLERVAPPGEYVLVMQQNGIVVIYGPDVWSTTQAESGLIQMRTAENRLKILN